MTIPINYQTIQTAIAFMSKPELPIHFFTIVLNGQPFIRYHIEIFKQLPFQWHWHIIEGVADLKHDTAWSIQLGGCISDKLHHNGRSNDSTEEYLDELARLYPDNVTIYRKPEGVFWEGKREMVNAPLVNIQEECLLWQVDVDELWTVEQLCAARQMFIDNPDKTAAFYWCWYFVGENLVISTRNCYAQNPQQEWLRTWRFKPGAFWAAHEPPVLVEPWSDGRNRNVAAVNPFVHEQTEQLGLIFQHFAYVTEEQLQFKEQYYGYTNAVSQWLKLQQQAKFPVFLSEYFAWVGDRTLVDTASSCGIIPIAQREINSNVWKFLQPDEVQQHAQIQKPAPIIVVDGVFFQLYQTGIARVWKSLLKEWVDNGFAQHIILLDRAGTAPTIPGIRYRQIPAYDYGHTDADREMLQQVCDEEGAEIFISTYYTTPTTTPSVFMAHDMIPELMGWDLRNPMWREKHYGIKHAAAYIAVSENTARDLVKCFPHITLDSVIVAQNGVDHKTFAVATQEKINQFKTKYGIVKPYFILVGAGSGYKNSILFFKAFTQLATKQGFDIVCTGSGGVLAPEWRVYTSGSTVHMLQLSDEELATAYSGAVALVYPSKYEGFGLPVLEAMACSCPVITCQVASIPEVAGEAAIYVKDNDVDGLANALCEVQKPHVRNSLISQGLEQAKQFYWSKMAKTVSSALIDATLLPLKLKEINLIIFPDWSQSEDILGLELQQVVRTLATHPDSQYITLLVETSNSTDDYAEFLLSAVSMNLLMQEDLDSAEELEISFVRQFDDMQWQALLPHIKARIILEHENKQALAKAETLPSCIVENFTDTQTGKFFFHLSQKLFQEERWQEVIAQYHKLLKVQVCEPDIYWQLSECYRQLNRLDESFSILQEGIKLYPSDGNLHFSLIISLRRNGRTQEAIESASAASNSLPDDYTFKLLKHLIVPTIYNHQDEISFYREQFTHGLRDLIQETSLKTAEEKQNALAGISRLTNFYLSYQAQNDVELQRKYGKLVHEIMAANYSNWVVPLSMPSLKPNNKIRVGYVSHYLHSYSGTLWLTGWLRHCDRASFEIYSYYTGNSPDPITQQFQDYSDVFYHIPHNLAATCEQIIADQLHILIYPEIGMDSQTMQMAGLRLAPVQCAAWGHPVTTGLPTIDYFLSSELMEPDNAQEHYSEKLIRLPNIGVSYPKPYIPPVIKTRSDYNLLDDAVIYLCCQAPFKYLPQYDFIFAEIARRVPQAKFVFLRGTILQERLNRAFAAVNLKSEDYCVFLTIPERFDYLMINLLSDVYLDTFTWSGGNTTLEAIACNLPIVTSGGEFMRGRHSYSFLKMIGVTDTIAENEAEYIEIAAKLGLNPTLRQDIAERIKQRHDYLFDDKTCVIGLETFYKQVIHSS
ncbi:glycosyltransferase [Iningainema tapete]|uniref:protein O-GlcNAc transferase n=1 Tax=Iningainema tapete BLCC-T55 TaxID=2748662 RepID=A0A8J6XKT4_9CYAN|nr:glycosyltransferase [Iningainema tapete]MBD2773419.1 glycosyltransferase [Iningainema tapete BLCC-T55]